QAQADQWLGLAVVFHENAPAVVELGVVTRRRRRQVDHIEEGRYGDGAKGAPVVNANVEKAVTRLAPDIALDDLPGVAQGLPGSQHVGMDDEHVVGPAGEILVAPGHLPAIADLPGQAEGSDMLAAE